ncbi:hypothetical protein GN244_ATG08273 [Phytophthora infestans]|uniref:Uncharacterized protein n=1 Tax=Phytophthora infestans TaxID=4787 RepID=A0A833WEW8_PHYIN|nr:hypothetical protein GN244_ATG08273 [Phytophthora infestans]
MGSEAGVLTTSKAGDRLTFSTVDMEATANEAADFVIDTTTAYPLVVPSRTRQLSTTKGRRG